MQEYYRMCKPLSRISSLKCGSFKQTSEPPRLRAKAAETRYLLAFAYELTQRMYAAVKSVHYSTLMECTRHLYCFYCTMGQAPFDPHFASESANSFLVLWKSLSDSAAAANLQMYPVKPKHHLLAELALHQVYDAGDPSLFWCYQDEDFVGIVGRIACSKGGKRGPSTTPRNVLLKYKGLNVEYR